MIDVKIEIIDQPNWGMPCSGLILSVKTEFPVAPRVGEDVSLGHKDLLRVDHVIICEQGVIVRCFQKVTPELQTLLKDAGWNVRNFRTDVVAESKQ